MKRIVFIALGLALASNTFASAIYPVQAKTGFLVGATIGVSSEVESMTGLSSQLQAGYDYALNRYVSIGIESGIHGQFYFDRNNEVYLFSIPALLSSKLVLSNGINFGLNVGGSGYFSTTRGDNETSIAPTVGASIGYKPTNSINISLNYDQSFNVKVNDDRFNVYSISLGITYTFGDNPINEDALFASQFNVQNNLPWYR